MHIGDRHTTGAWELEQKKNSGSVWPNAFGFALAGLAGFPLPYLRIPCRKELFFPISALGVFNDPAEGSPTATLLRLAVRVNHRVIFMQLPVVNTAASWTRLALHADDCSPTSAKGRVCGVPRRKAS